MTNLLSPDLAPVTFAQLAKANPPQYLSSLIPLQMPAGLGWDMVNYPLSVSLYDVPGLGRPTGVVYYAGQVMTAENLFNSKSTALSSPGAQYYIATNGNDTHDGLTPATAFATWNHGITVANTGGVPTTLIDVNGGGTYYFVASPAGTGSGVSPTVDIAFVCPSGRVKTGSIIATPTMTKDATYTNTYSVARSAIQRVGDMVNLNRFGNYTDLQAMQSAAACNVTPNSWYTDGTTLYINRVDGALPTSANTRLFLSGQHGAFWITSQVNIYIGDGGGVGGFPLGGFDCEGATGSGESGSLNWYIATPNNSLTNLLVAKNSSFNYAGGITDTAASGTGLQSFNGLAAFFGCRSDENQADGFHAKNTFAATQCAMLTVNCTGQDNGRTPTQSCQAYTLHQNNIGIDVAGYYRDSHGGNIRNIQTTRMWACGTRCENDRGDVCNGGALQPAGISMSDSATIWADRVKVDQLSGEYAMVTEGGSASIYTRNCWPTGAIVGGPGTIAPY